MTEYETLDGSKTDAESAESENEFRRGEVSIFDVNVEVFRATALQRRRNYHAMMEIIGSLLVEDVDYGRVHFVKKEKCGALSKGRTCNNLNHYSKHQLRKSGAEKLTSLFGLRATFPDNELIFETIRRGSKPDVFILRCLLINDDDLVVGEGSGARSLAQDFGDYNKAIKMAQKSAHVDAVIRTFGLSDRFEAEDGSEYTENVSEKTLEDSPDALQLLRERTSEIFDGIAGTDEQEKILAAMCARMFRIESGNILELKAKDVPAALTALERKRELMVADHENSDG